MPRTTLNLDVVVLRQLVLLREQTGRALGDLASELLARALKDRPEGSNPEPLDWLAKPMKARVDLEDKDAVQALFETTHHR